MMRTRVTLTMLTLSSSLISFASYTLLLKYLGASAAMDLLFYAASVPLALGGVASGVLLYLLPARFTQVSHRVQDSTVRLLALFFVVVSCGLIAVLLVYGILQGRFLLLALLVGFTLVALILLISTLLVCVAQARGAYLATGVAPMIISVGLMAGVLLAIAMGIEWLLLIGQLLGAASAVWWLVHSQRLAPALRVRDLLLAKVALRSLKPHVLSIILGAMAFTLFQPIDAALCVRLDDGSLTVMSYAQRVVVAVGTAVSLGAFAVAARTSRDSLRAGGQLALRRIANREVLRMVAFGLVLWLAYVLGGSRLLGALLASSAMSSYDLSRLLECVKWMLLGAGPMATMPYLFQVFYSRETFHSPALLGVGIASAYGLFAWLMIPRYDILALAYAYSSVWWSALVVALLLLNMTASHGDQRDSGL